MKIVNLQNNIIFSHIPPTEERIMKRNFDGTIGKWDNIRDWIFDINMQYKESVYTFIMYGAKYCNSLIGLDQDDIEKMIWTSGKGNLKTCLPMGSELFRAAMGVDTDKSLTYSLQQGTSIQNIDNFTEPYDLSYLEKYGVTITIHAHKPHLGFYTKRCGNVMSIAIDHLRANNALYFDNEKWLCRTIEKNQSLPNTSTYGHIVDVYLNNNNVYGNIRFPGGNALCNIISEHIGSRYGPWSVISTECKLDNDNNNYVMLAAQYECFPNFQLYVQFVELENFLKNNFNYEKPKL